MGYCADVIKLERNGEETTWPIVLHTSRLEDVWEKLKEAESASGTHISWCDPIDKYTGTLAEKIAAIFRDYGFDETNVEDDTVHIGQWGSNKLGISWPEMIRAIAVGVDPADQYVLYLAGEDYHMWYELLFGGQVSSITMSISFDK